MGLKVLVVDDSRLARMVTARLLANLRPTWLPVEAVDAEETLLKAATERFDVALLDFNMPGKNGLALAGELLALQPGLPIAIVSANVQDEIVEAANALGASFVAKPVTAAGLTPFISGIHSETAA